MQVCQRCGAFSCSTCARQFEVHRLCADCHWRWARSPASPVVWWAWWLTLGGFVTCGLSGLVGLLLSVQELGRIKRAEAPLAGRGLAKATRTLGLTQLAWLVFLVIGPIITTLVVRGR